MRLSIRINNFNTFYHMTSDHKAWRKWNAEEKAINNEINNLSANEAKEVFALLTDAAKETEFGLAIEALIPRPVSIQSRVFTAAWKFIKSGKSSNLSDALKRAWKLVKGFAEVIGKSLTFAYTKADGTHRAASGTISSVYVSKAGKAMVKYWDSLKKGYRQFELSNLITSINL